MMMNRHRSTSRSRTRSSAARDAESRQPLQEDGRTATPNVPRSPRSTSTPSSNANTGLSPPPPPPSSFPKTRCYRLNLEKPFDIRDQKSPLGRDYSGPPIQESDLPPAQGPVEYLPPAHLCSKEEMAWRRHSWGGAAASVLSGNTGGMSTPAELMANLHVSLSEESTNSNSDPTSIAISTARIFRGIVVDRNGVITSMNERAQRSANKNGNAKKNKVGEKSRQSAKIDKAKDLIDDMDNGGSAMSDEENDPSKIVSLFVMGEYEDLNDLVRDGSKKLKDSKFLTDEAILMYNRPRLFPQGSMPQPMSGVGTTPLSPNNSAYSSSYNGDPTPSSTSGRGASLSPIANIRKRVFSADKSRSRYKQVPRSAPPKLKGNPRDSASRSSRGSSGRSPTANAGSPSTQYHRGSSTASVHGHNGPFGCVQLGGDPTKQGAQQGGGHPNYFQQQCNFFPGNSDWTEALGFSVNSLWNCGANGGHLSPTMSPHSNPSSPRNNGTSSQHQDAHGGGYRVATGGGVYHGSGAPVTPSSNAGYHHHGATTPSGYHSSSGYHHQGSASAGYNGYNSQYRVEGRNPSYGYGTRGGSAAGVRDTVVM